MGYTPHVLVVGGGAVGTGVARDLAIRGLEVTLVERGSLAGGTSGSMHALLHSGARYAVDEPEVAATCQRENDVLRHIGEHLIETTGGLFVRRSGDDPDYAEAHRDACETADIDCERLSSKRAREREPRLAPDIQGALAVSDAVIDPFGLCVANALSANAHGADIQTDVSVTNIRKDGDAIDSVKLRSSDGVTQEHSPDFLVNATGPWAERIAGMADCSAPVRHVQGAMLAVDRTGLSSVVNRWRPPAEGDIAVPFGPSAVLGTTTRPIEGPDAIDRTHAEIDQLVDELGTTVPDVADAAPRRAYWGIRALPPKEDKTASRTATVIDHEETEGLWGMISVFGGKLTTHRATAERVVDRICAAFGIRRACQTAELGLPTVPPTDSVGPTVGADPVLCVSQGVTRSAIRAVLDHDVIGGDLRTASRLTRAGMGPCQGGRCAHQLAAQVDQTAALQPIDEALAAFANERWAGRRYTLWGSGAAEALSTYDFHARGLNRERDPPDWDQFAGMEETDE